MPSFRRIRSQVVLDIFFRIIIQHPDFPLRALHDPQHALEVGARGTFDFDIFAHSKIFARRDHGAYDALYSRNPLGSIRLRVCYPLFRFRHRGPRLKPSHTAPSVTNDVL